MYIGPMDLGLLTQYQLNYTICLQCKYPVPENSGYCLNCGSSLDVKTNDRKRKNSSSSQSVIQTTSLPQSFEKQDIIFSDFPEEMRKIALSKRQKENDITGFFLRFLDFVLTKPDSGSLGLMSLAHIKVEPRPYQIESAINIIENMGGSGILADEVGLGKTIEAGIVIKEMVLRRTAMKILILVPASLLSQWKLELADKFGLETWTDEDIDKLESDFSEGIFLLSLHRAKSKKIQGLFKAIIWDLLVVDEAHSLKNHLTQAHRFVYSLRRKYTILLTATPIQNDMRELYNLINIVKPGYFKSIRYFRRKFMVDRYLPRNPDELRRLCSRVMVRHRRTDTLIKLPPRRVNTTVIDISPLEMEFYNLTMELARKAASEASERNDNLMLLLSILLKESTSSPQALLSTLEGAILPKVIRDREFHLLRQLIDTGKHLDYTTKMLKLIDIINKEDSPIIIYTEYVKTMEVIERLLKRNNLVVSTYSGKLRQNEKDDVLGFFRTKGGILLSTEVGGQGLNLQHCHRMINFDLPWNPMRLEQRIGRIHRFGQQQEVEITTMAGRGTFEEYLVNILVSKIKLFQMVIGEIDSILAYLKDPLPIERKIGRIILESSDSTSLQKRLDKLANEILEAKAIFEKDQALNTEFLDLPAGMNDVH